MSFQTVRMKPNPAGKDRGKHGATAAQLAAEWVDLKNTNAYAVNITGVRLMHVAYPPGSAHGYWAEVMSFKGTLQAGQVIRVHAGQNRGTSVIRSADLVGADIHLFTGEDEYVWNNDKSDTASLWEAGQTQPYDTASYEAPAPEGIILVRSGNKLLVPAGVVRNR